MEWFFKTPERKANPEDGTVQYDVHFQTPHRLLTRIEYDGRTYIPNITFQVELEPLIQSLLSTIAQTPTLFRTPPTLKSLQSITPVWGAVIQNGVLQWNPRGGRLPELPREWTGRAARVCFLLEGVQITRSAILPLWAIHSDIQPAPGVPPPDLIDFTFDGSGGGDARSVASASSADVSIETDGEGGVFELEDHQKEKRVAKTHVRQLLRRSMEARMAADTALDHFLEEYDLSDGESDFSDADD